MQAFRAALVIVIVSAIVATAAVRVLDRDARSRLSRALQVGPVSQVEAHAR